MHVSLARSNICSRALVQLTISNSLISGHFASVLFVYLVSSDELRDDKEKKEGRKKESDKLKYYSESMNSISRWNVRNGDSRGGRGDGEE